MILHRQFKITPMALEKMKAHLTKAYPKEGCGLLAGTGTGLVEEVFRAVNSTKKDRAAGHYEIDPLILYELEKKAEEKGYSVLGFYHSHPDCEARVSPEDEAQMIPRMLYVIASVNNGKCGEIKGYIKDL